MMILPVGSVFSDRQLVFAVVPNRTVAEHLFTLGDDVILFVARGLKDWKALIEEILNIYRLDSDVRGLVISLHDKYVVLLLFHDKPLSNSPILFIDGSSEVKFWTKLNFYFQ